MKKQFIPLIVSLVAYSSLVAQTPTLNWAKNLGGTGGDGGNAIAVDKNGNVLTTGYFVNTADFDPGASALSFTSAGGKDVFISKLDAAGNLVWAKQIGSTGNDEGAYLAVDTLGNVYVTGSFEATVDFDPNAGTSNLTSAGMADIFVLKLDAAGTLVWAKRLGGTVADASRAIGVSADFSVYTTGQFNGTADFDPDGGVSNLVSGGGSDIFVSKLNASGGFAWAKQMGSTATDFGFSLALTTAGEVYTTGYFNGTVDFDPSGATASLSSAGSDDIFISKLDASGNYLWAKTVGGTAADRGYWVATNASGNAFLTGFFNGTADFDPSGAVFNFTSAGTGDVFILNLDANGNFVWAKQMGGTMDNVGHSIAADAAGNTYLTGVFQGTCDYDPSAAVLSFTAAGPNDIFLAKLNPSGDLVWAAQVGGSSSDLGETIAIDAAGYVYTSGVFLGTTDFDPTSGSSTLTSAGGGDVFVLKLTDLTTSIIETNDVVAILTTFPNPVKDFLMVETMDSGVLYLFDAQGRMMISQEIIPGSISIDMSNLPAGFYVVRMGGKVAKVLKG